MGRGEGGGGRWGREGSRNRQISFVKEEIFKKQVSLKESMKMENTSETYKLKVCR